MLQAILRQGSLVRQHFLGIVPTPLRLLTIEVHTSEPAIHAAAQLDPVRFAFKQLLTVLADGIFILLGFYQRRVWPGGEPREPQIH